MHPYLRTLLPLAALLTLVPPATAHAQDTRPRKRVAMVYTGMSARDAVAALGRPVEVRRRDGATYLYYPARGGDDVVVIRDCRVESARFQHPDRVYQPANGRTPAPARADADCPGLPAPPVAVVSPAPPAAPEPPPAGPVPPPSAPVEPAPAPPAPAPAPAPTPPPAPATAVSSAQACGDLSFVDSRGRPISALEWRRRLALRRPTSRIVGVPAASISSPTAFGVDFGEAFVGAAYQQRTRFTDEDDGAAVIGIGLGDRIHAVGVEVAATSYSTIRGGGPVETGGVSFKVHRAFGDRMGVAVGVENAVNWGGSDAGTSAYGVVTRVFQRTEDTSRPFNSVVASLGVGNGRFRFEDDVDDGKETVNLFGSLGVLVVEPLSLIADWNGQDLYAAASWRPVRRLPLVVNAGFADLTGTAGDGARFILSAGYGFRIPGPWDRAGRDY